MFWPPSLRHMMFLALSALSGCGGGSSEPESPMNAPTSVVVAGHTITASPYANIYNQNSSSGYRCPSSEYGLAFKVSPAMEPARLQTLIQQISVYRGTDSNTALPVERSISVFQISGGPLLGAVVGGSACVGNELAVGDTLWMVIRFNQDSTPVNLKSETVKVISIS